MPDQTLQFVIAAQDNATQVINQITQSITVLNNAAEKAGKEGGGGLGMFGDGLAKLGLEGLGIHAIIDGVKGLGDMAMRLTEGNAQIENYTTSFTTLLGSRANAEAFVGVLKNIADTTPYTTEQITNAGQTLLSFGVAARDVPDLLTKIGDASSALNSPIGETTFWFGRLYSGLQGGKPVGEAVMRLQELKILSPQVANSLQAMQMSGASFSDEWALVTKSLDNFHDGMKLQSMTLQGMTSTFEDSMTRISNALAKPAFDAFEVVLAGALDLLDPSKHPEIQAGIEVLADGIKGLIQDIGALFGVDMNALEKQHQAEMDAISQRMAARKAEMDAITQTTKSIQAQVTEEEAHVHQMQQSLDVVKERNRLEKEQRDMAKEALQDRIADLEKQAKAATLPIEQQLYELGLKKKDTEQQLKDLTEQQKAASEAAKASEDAMLQSLQDQLATMKDQHAEAKQRLDDAKDALQAQLDAAQKATRDELLPVEQHLYDLSIQRKDAESQLQDVIARQKDAMDAMDEAEQHRLDALNAQYQNLQDQNDARKQQNDLIIQGIEAQMGELTDQVNSQTKPLEDELTDLQIRRHKLELEALETTDEERKKQIKDELDQIKQRTDLLDAEKQVIEDTVLKQKQSLEEQQKAAEEKAKQDDENAKKQQDALKQQIDAEKKAYDEHKKQVEEQNKAEQASLQAKIDGYKAQEDSLDRQKHDIEEAGKLQQQVIQDQLKDIERKSQELDKQNKAQEEALQKQVDAQKKANEDADKARDAADKAQDDLLKKQMDGYDTQSEQLNRQKDQIEQNSKKAVEGLQDQFTALERYGKEQDRQASDAEHAAELQIKAIQNQIQTQKDGMEANKQKAQELGDSINKEVNQPFDASNDAAKKLRDQIDEMKKHMEEGLKPFTDLVSTLRDNAIPLMAGLAVVVADALIPALIAAGVAAWGALAPILLTEAPILLIGAAVALVAKAWIEDWGGIQEKTAGVLHWLGDRLGDLGHWLTVDVPGMLKSAGDAFSALGTNVKGAMDDLFKWLTNASDSTFKWLDNAADSIYKTVGGAFDSLGASIHNAWNNLLEWLKGKTNDFKTTASNIGGALSEAITNAIPNLQRALAQAGHEIMTWAGDRLNDIKNQASQWGSAIADWPTRSFGYLQTQLGQVRDEIAGWFRDRLNDIKDFAGNLATNLINSLTSGINNLSGMIGNAIKGALNAAMDSIPWPFGMQPPHFAHGGVMGQSGMAIVGENGPEMVLLPGGARVFTHNETQQMLTQSSNRGGDTFITTINTTSPYESVISDLMSLQLLRSGGART